MCAIKVELKPTLFMILLNAPHNVDDFYYYYSY